MGLFMEKKEVFAKEICFKKIFWIFMFGCLFGCIFEMLWHFINYGNWVSRKGVIYGPLNPVYGLGAVIFTLFLVKIKNPMMIFIGGMILGGGCEYICSLFQEEVFGTVSWDYDNSFLNLHGRTSLFYMLVWGVLAIGYVKMVYPFLSKWIERIPVRTGNVLTVVLAIFMVVNLSISLTACLRQEERNQGIPADNSFEVFLDETYPDKRLDEIFENSKKVSK